MLTKEQRAVRRSAIQRFRRNRVVPPGMDVCGNGNSDRLYVNSRKFERADVMFLNSKRGREIGKRYATTPFRTDYYGTVVIRDLLGS